MARMDKVKAKLRPAPRPGPAGRSQNAVKTPRDKRYALG